MTDSLLLLSRIGKTANSLWFADLHKALRPIWIEDGHFVQVRVVGDPERIRSDSFAKSAVLGGTDDSKAGDTAYTELCGAVFIS